MKSEVPTAKHMASLQLLCTVGSDCSEPAYRSEIKFCQRGGEAGRAHDCKKGKGIGIITPTKISGGIKGLNLGSSISSSEGCLSIYCFIWVSSSIKSFCS
jgi:hypothetical protein